MTTNCVDKLNILFKAAKSLAKSPAKITSITGSKYAIAPSHIGTSAPFYTFAIVFASASTKNLL